MDAGERANAIRSDEQAELIAWRTGQLLQGLDNIEKRLQSLERSILSTLRGELPELGPFPDDAASAA